MCANRIRNDSGGVFCSCAHSFWFPSNRDVFFAVVKNHRLNTLCIPGSVTVKRFYCLNTMISDEYVETADDLKGSLTVLLFYPKSLYAFRLNND